MRAFDRELLDQAILAAHEAGDRIGLTRLYREAAEALDRTGQSDAACFFLTQAYVFALDAGVAEAGDLRAALHDRGRI